MTKIHNRLHTILYGDPEGEYYFCNQAVKANPDKMTSDWNKVTCKNCLRKRPNAVLSMY